MPSPAPEPDPAIAELIATLGDHQHPVAHGGIWENGQLMFPRLLELDRWVATLGPLIDRIAFIENFAIWHVVTPPRGRSMDEIQPATPGVLGYTWRVHPSRVRAILSNTPHIDRDDQTGAKIYRWANALAARAALPGQGTRTDLRDTTSPTA